MIGVGPVAEVTIFAEDWLDIAAEIDFGILPDGWFWHQDQNST
jgi:hypothetical protein